MAKLQSRNDVRLKRHARVRRKISGTAGTKHFGRVRRSYSRKYLCEE